MFPRVSKLSAITIAAVATIAMGCHHASKVAVAPAIAPQKAMTSSPLPEARVTPPEHEFTSPKSTSADDSDDPMKETLLAEQKGWIRDAFFDYDSAAIEPEAGKNLQSTAKWLRDHGRYHILLEGHCDERGTEQYNLALGEKRAWDAKEYLTALGVDPLKVSTISYGKDKPFAEGHDEESWAKNRRAHVVLTSSTK